MVASNHSGKKQKQPAPGQSIESQGGGDDQKDALDLDVCRKAPEMAEHERWHDEDQPCDDGRSGKLG